jgi:hypothetical protein
MPSYTIYASTNDFGVYSASGTYSTARAGEGTNGIYSGDVPHYVDNSLWAGHTYYCDQYFCRFDTGAVVGTQTARSFHFVAYALSGAGTVIEAAPHNWTTSESLSEFVPGASLPSPHGEVNANSNGVKRITLGTDVPVGSAAKYLLWAKGQRQNTVPTGEDWIALYPADTFGTIDDPYLSIETETDVTPPTITSSASVSATFGSPLSHSLTADEAVTWSIIGGTHQSSFELSGSTLRYASNANAVDGPRYVTVRATDASSNWTEQDITVRVYEFGDTGLKTAASITGTGWTNADNARAADNSYATHTLASNGGTTNPLLPTSYLMGVPSTAEILGIQSAVERFASGNNIRDNVVQLRMDGANVGSDKATATNWPTTDTETTYGNSTDLWGLTPTAAQINATDFGVAFGVRSATSQSRTISVDSIRLRVWWRDEKLAASSGAGQPKVRIGTTSWDRKPIKWWSGSAWVEKPLKRWTGSEWVLS